MSLFKIASVAAIALTLGACQSLFQPNYRAPLETTRDASEQLKPGCKDQDCPLVNIDIVHFPAEPTLDGIIEKRLLQMTRTSPDAPWRRHWPRIANSFCAPPARATAVICNRKYASSMTAW